MNIKIISRDEALKIAPQWPADVSFSEVFGRLHTVRHGFKSGYVLVDSGRGKLIFPIQWGNGFAYSVHKGHTMPYNIGGAFDKPQWSDIAKEVRRLTKANLYIADLAVTEEMADGLSRLPSAVFIIDTASHNLETVFSSFNKTTRNLIRRSQEQNFRIETISGVMPERYYELYISHQLSMGTPPRAKEYFDEVANIFDSGFVIIGAYDGDRLVGMNLFWTTDNGLWLSINSSVAEYGPRHVNYLLYYETIRWACEHKINRIDLGGSPTRDGNVHNVFKLGFGATMVPLYRLTAGSFSARLVDKFRRKKRAALIRLNKLWKN